MPRFACAAFLFGMCAVNASFASYQEELSPETPRTKVVRLSAEVQGLQSAVKERENYIGALHQKCLRESMNKKLVALAQKKLRESQDLAAMERYAGLKMMTELSNKNDALAEENEQLKAENASKDEQIKALEAANAKLMSMLDEANQRKKGSFKGSRKK